jgi:glyoxylase I family protein
MFFERTNSCSVSSAFSRPNPLPLTPPNGDPRNARRRGEGPGKGRFVLWRHQHRHIKQRTIIVAISGTMPAISHVAVTVTDLSVSEAWYTRLFGVGPVLDEDTGPFRHIVYALGNTLFGLHGFPELTSKEQFDERRPGLDHVSFGCASRAELTEWAARLDALGVAHGEIVDAGYGSGLSFRDPDNIALELFAPPA